MNNRIGRYIFCFLGMMIFFFLGMILVYQIPNKMIRPQYNKSMDQIAKEDVYAIFYLIPMLLFSIILRIN